jgi:hypothetical protein
MKLGALVATGMLVAATAGAVQSQTTNVGMGGRGFRSAQNGQFYRFDANAGQMRRATVLPDNQRNIAYGHQAMTQRRLAVGRRLAPVPSNTVRTFVPARRGR